MGGVCVMASLRLMAIFVSLSHGADRCAHAADVSAAAVASGVTQLSQAKEFRVRQMVGKQITIISTDWATTARENGGVHNVNGKGNECACMKIQACLNVARRTGQDKALNKGVRGGKKRDMDVRAGPRRRPRCDISISAHNADLPASSLQ